MLPPAKPTPVDHHLKVAAGGVLASRPAHVTAKAPQGDHLQEASPSLLQRHDKVLLRDLSSLARFGRQAGHEAYPSDTVADGMACQSLPPGVGARNQLSKPDQASRPTHPRSRLPPCRPSQGDSRCPDLRRLKPGAWRCAWRLENPIGEGG
jgi:hypothetical protein